MPIETDSQPPKNEKTCPKPSSTPALSDVIKTPDAGQNHWIYKIAPDAMIPYLQLMRADRPIGTWLLLWPCLWAIAMASHMLRGDVSEGLSGNMSVNKDFIFFIPNLSLMALFALGAFVMRGAGCVVNDIVDRKFDAQVERTKNRPIPSGRVSVPMALVFVGLLCAVGLMILLTLNDFTILLTFCSVFLIILYPFMKRITYWPQFILGLTFNWGALVGWAAVTGSISSAAIFLYIGGIFWTLGYDTIYAHQDKEDDIKIGVKSTALRLQDKTKYWLVGFYSATIINFTIAGFLSGYSTAYFMLMIFPAAHFFYQIYNLDIHDRDNCLKLFKANHHFGLIFFISLIISPYI